MPRLFRKMTRKGYVVCAVLLAVHVLTINLVIFRYTKNDKGLLDTIHASLQILGGSGDLTGALSKSGASSTTSAEDAVTTELLDDIDTLPWNELTLEQKLKRKVREVDTTKAESWMVNTTLKFTDVEIDLDDFLPPLEEDVAQAKKGKSQRVNSKRADSIENSEFFKGNENSKSSDSSSEDSDAEPVLSDEVVLKDDDEGYVEPKQNFLHNSTLWYDLRFTLAMYIDYIKTQHLERNPQNIESKEPTMQITVPFHWSDWVDMDILNKEIAKPEKDQMTCQKLIETSEGKQASSGYCINSKDVTSKMLEEMGLHSTNQLPGFVVKSPPNNVNTPRAKLLEAKAHLLTYGQLPLSIVFLSHDGFYDVKVGRRQRIVDSSLITSYLRTHGIDASIKENRHITVNAVKEFRSLTESVPARVSESTKDGLVINYDEALSKNHYKMVLNEELFHWDQKEVDKEMEGYAARLKEIDDMTKETQSFDEERYYKLALNDHEQNHYNFLKYSSTFTPDTQEIYFKLARMTGINGNMEDGWHLEWRFFNGRLSYEEDRRGRWTHAEVEERHKIIVHRLLRNWSQFSYQLGIIQWVNHGALLAWYWNGVSFPYDDDVDVQLPAKVLDNFARRFNQSLIIEDINSGYGRYFVDCNAFMTHRTHGNGLNNIDARFIDVDSGAYIDITGLTLTNQHKPGKYEKLKGKNRNEVYNCKNSHFYHIDELSPAKYTRLEGAPLLIPRNFTSILAEEYLYGFSNVEYAGWYFVEPLRIWLTGGTIKKVLSIPPNLENEREHILTRLASLKPRHVLKFLDDKEVMHEYYLTQQFTEVHEKEKAILFDNAEKMTPENVESYIDLASSFKMGSPLRKPYFEYEYIERSYFRDQIRKSKEMADEADEEEDVAEHINALEQGET
ncbi:unnamed protein product [Kuraishia capsulata CBS 1993]|uniref:LicD/FKTN/FKRP nucleotidyltransferase domain-containing protein n=1 Tax=Kuraishia capsulata CBS 1993 TaxID=1382522 RepID=W6MNB6_9ASCO|nr:uncharacterized protein KUCA_T00004135001 [Kuraishia capsulata CBS 1993]CDK28154.1 unnamed protein product [Kuraishia capsulata CBS 1993]